MRRVRKRISPGKLRLPSSAGRAPGASVGALVAGTPTHGPDALRQPRAGLHRWCRLAVRRLHVGLLVLLRAAGLGVAAPTTCVAATVASRRQANPAVTDTAERTGVPWALNTSQCAGRTARNVGLFAREASWRPFSSHAGRRPRAFVLWPHQPTVVRPNQHNDAGRRWTVGSSARQLALTHRLHRLRYRLRQTLGRGAGRTPLPIGPRPRQRRRHCRRAWAEQTEGQGHGVAAGLPIRHHCGVKFRLASSLPTEARLRSIPNLSAISAAAICRVLRSHDASPSLRSHRFRDPHQNQRCGTETGNLSRNRRQGPSTAGGVPPARHQ